MIQRVNRNRCQYCRLKKCIAVGMSRDGEFNQIFDAFHTQKVIDKTIRKWRNFSSKKTSASKKNRLINSEKKEKEKNCITTRTCPWDSSMTRAVCVELHRLCARLCNEFGYDEEGENVVEGGSECRSLRENWESETVWWRLRRGWKFFINF